MIRPATLNDAQNICAIYNYFVENTVISFEEEQISVDEMKDRISIISAEYPYFVYEEQGDVLGYAYASLWKTRSAYRFTLESTVYVSPEAKGKGIGSALYVKLLDALDETMVRSVIGVIALPNDASVGLHEKMGFEKVAHFKEVGFKREQWIDVGFWQKML